jgi:transcriptional regulator of arginine metabolism
MHKTLVIEIQSRRRQALAELLRSGAGASQDELVNALRTQGFSVTQATISRDLDQLGAMRGRGGYALPDSLAPSPAYSADQLRAIVGQWVHSVDPAGQLVVLRTPPGSAHLVGVALDRAPIDGVVGTICGDDTIFVAAASPAKARSLATRLRVLAGLRDPSAAV